MKQVANRLNQKKYTHKHRDRLDDSLIFDVKACKALGEFYMPKILSSDKLSGYVQSISLDPFGFLLISQQQVFSHIKFSI